MNTDNVASYAAAIAKPATRSSAYETEAMAEYKEGARALIVDQLENTAVPRPRTPSYATFSSAYAEAMTNIFSDAATQKLKEARPHPAETTSIARERVESFRMKRA